jgi:hypothetical protein
VILDDPLQNMDELTVSALARGVAKVMRPDIFPKGWRLVIMFHGQDDLERFRHEVPSAVYYLPWLTSAVSANAPEIPIKADARKNSAEGFQNLATIINAQGTAGQA